MAGTTGNLNYYNTLKVPSMFYKFLKVMVYQQVHTVYTQFRFTNNVYNITMLHFKLLVNPNLIIKDLVCFKKNKITSSLWSDSIKGLSPEASFSKHIL